MMFFCFPLISSEASATTTRTPGINEPGDGNVFLGVQGTYENVSVEDVLTRINELRLEAYNEGFVSEYIPIKWSKELEYMAQIRAAEASVLESHSRPRGSSALYMNVNGVTAYAENLDWGVNALQSIEDWYTEKPEYEINPDSAKAGHYKTLIARYCRYVGFGSFARLGKHRSVSALFTDATGTPTEEKYNASGDYIQLIEVPESKISLSVSGPDSVAVGKTGSYTLNAVYNNRDLIVPSAVWQSSTAKAGVSAAGKLTGKAVGNTTVTGKPAFNGKTGSIEASKDVTITIGANPMTVTGKTAIVKYTAVKKKAQTLKRYKVLTVKNNKGTTTYTKKTGNRKILVNRTTGKVTVKKGIKRGLYKVTVSIRAAGNANYKALTKKATFRIRVK